jgi:TRAP transporter TAXI family solute receptor
MEKIHRPQKQSLKKLSKHRNLKNYLKFIGPGTIISAIGLFIAYQFVDPAPPRQLTIATGSTDGAYYAFGKEYSRMLQKYGITLHVKSTAGSVENLRLLEKADGNVDVAFMQGGIHTSGNAEDIIALGSLYYEPLWIFVQTEFEVEKLSDLKGGQIAVGSEGSGTRALAMQLLELNNISTQNSIIVSMSGEKAADKLVLGELDAGFFVTAPHSPVIQKLLRSKEIKLMSMRRAAAYESRLHYLSGLSLAEGAIDPSENIPSTDIKLIAPTTQLVARADIHAALIDLLLQAATEIHHKGGLFEKTGEFPSPEYLDFKLSQEAERFYRSGPSFLQRYLPFWVATFLDRTKVMLLPLVALIFPLFKLMPLVYRWRIRRKIFRWYREIAQVDPDLNPDLYTNRFGQALRSLDRMEAEVSKISVPLGFTQELYHLRLHIEMLRNRMLKTDSKKAGSGGDRL